MKKGPFSGCRDDWQMPGRSGPKTKRRAKKMRKPPFNRRSEMSKFKIITDIGPPGPDETIRFMWEDKIIDVNEQDGRLILRSVHPQNPALMISPEVSNVIMVEAVPFASPTRRVVR